MLLGKYKHFKGTHCHVIGLAKHSETKEEMVVYWHIDESGEKSLWVRPKKMFLDEVEVGGQKVARFVYIGGEDE